jgi:hypothetical protein
MIIPLAGPTLFFFFKRELSSPATPAHSTVSTPTRARLHTVLNDYNYFSFIAIKTNLQQINISTTGKTSPGEEIFRQTPVKNSSRPNTFQTEPLPGDHWFLTAAVVLFFSNPYTGTKNTIPGSAIHCCLNLISESFLFFLFGILRF